MTDAGAIPKLPKATLYICWPNSPYAGKLPSVICLQPANVGHTLRSFNILVLQKSARRSLKKIEIEFRFPPAQSLTEKFSSIFRGIYYNSITNRSISYLLSVLSLSLPAGLNIV